MVFTYILKILSKSIDNNDDFIFSYNYPKILKYLENIKQENTKILDDGESFWPNPNLCLYLEKFLPYI